VSRRLRVALEAVVSAVVLGVLLWMSHPGEIWRALSALHPGWFALAVAVNAATVVLMAWRWMLLLDDELNPGLGWLVRTSFVALFAGQFLPTAIGGDAVRAIELGRRTRDSAAAVASILIDRLVGVVALILLALVAVAAGGRAVGGWELVAVEAGLGAAAVAALLVLFSPRARAVVARVLQPRADGHRLGAGQRFYDALHAYRDRRGTLLAVGAIALLVQVARIGVVWLLVIALGLDVSASTLLVAVPVLFAALIVPVSLNGIGVREAVFVYFLHDADTSVAEAIALGVAFFAVASATALGGAAVLAVRFVRYGAGAVRPQRRIEGV
jgi:uncharacterized protein (TIRG00374 family)